MKKRISGIKINYSLSKGKNTSFFDAYFYAAYSTGKEKGSEFISSKKIRKTLKSMDLGKENLELGEISLMYEHKTKTAGFISFYPLGKMPTEEIKKKGIAGFLELLALLEMKKRIPSIQRIKHFVVSSSRIKHLEKRGINYGKDYSFEEAIKKIREKLRKDMKKELEKKTITKIRRIAGKIKKKTGVNRLKHYIKAFS